MPAGRTQRPGTLSYDDARILRLESASIKAHTCKVMIVEPGPGGTIELDRLRERVAAEIGRMPRGRQRVAFAPDGDPAWVDDPDFDLEAHVVQKQIEGPIDRGRLREIAGELMAERLDHERPLWRLDLVSPLEDGGAAIVMRVHHAMDVEGDRSHLSLLFDCGEETQRAKRHRRIRARSTTGQVAGAASE